jgi:hypothetical protein
MRSSRPPVPRPPRHCVGLGCQVVRLHDFRLLSSAIENLSIGGMLSGHSAAAAPGDQLIVSFYLPIAGRWIDADAEVARVIQGRRPTDAGRQLGIRFRRLSAASERRIGWALEKAPPVPPLMRPGRRNWSPELRTFVLESGWIRSSLGHWLPRWWGRE